MPSFAMPNSCAGTKELFLLGNTGELRDLELSFHTADVPRGTSEPESSIGARFETDVLFHVEQIAARENSQDFMR